MPPMSKRGDGPLCLRLPADLHAAVVQMAEASQITTSEWVRDMLFRIVYGTPPGIDEGYMHGRALGMRIVHHALKTAADHLPTTAEEAQAMLQLGSPGRTPHG